MEDTKKTKDATGLINTDKKPRTQLPSLKTEMYPFINLFKPLMNKQALFLINFVYQLIHGVFTQLVLGWH